jgi:hypothetical protein
MVKTHKITGLQYLCQTKRKDPFKYRGSGLYWRLHLKKHGPHIDTRILIKCYTKSALSAWGIYYSKLWSIVDSKRWANLTEETGSGGMIAGSKTAIKCGLSGSKHPQYNATIYHFIHTDGREERLTKYEMYTKYDLHIRRLHSVANGGKDKSINGWRLITTPETGVGYGSGAIKRRGRTKENDASVARTAANQVGKRKTFETTNPNRDPIIYHFIHTDGREERLTRYEMYTKYGLNIGHVHELVHGKRKSHRGWRLSTRHTSA